VLVGSLRVCTAFQADARASSWVVATLKWQKATRSDSKCRPKPMISRSTASSSAFEGLHSLVFEGVHGMARCEVDVRRTAARETFRSGLGWKAYEALAAPVRPYNRTTVSILPKRRLAAAIITALQPQLGEPVAGSSAIKKKLERVASPSTAPPKNLKLVETNLYPSCPSACHSLDVVEAMLTRGPFFGPVVIPCPR
jgi:hypothetical protein